MPVKLADGLPAIEILEKEGIEIIPESRAFKQDIRPLQVAILNIMPRKSVAETQLLRLLSHSPLQISVTFICPSSHTCKNTAPEHLARFYESFDRVRDRRFDALIITGAPVETLDFEQVTYWPEFRQILEWSRTHVYSTFHICWAAQAGLYHHFGVAKYTLPQKMFGVFNHRVVDSTNALVSGFDEEFFAPHSRHSNVYAYDVQKVSGLSVVSQSTEAGIYIVSAHKNRQVFVTGHPEYDRFTLREEYERDRGRNLQPALPRYYFPGDDSAEIPSLKWRSHASLLFSNWLHLVYQNTPYVLEDLVAL